MLVGENLEIVDKISFNQRKVKTKKKQILLYDTYRRMDDFLNKLKYRKNGKYEEIPHFVVSKLGIIVQLLDTNYASKTFGNKQLDNKLIKIAIENLGWLNKNTITGYLNNWIGDPFRAEPYVRNWRDYYYWDRYSDAQMESLVRLCEFLCNKHEIPPQIVPSQAYIENIAKYGGVACKSNYSDIYTDINPSFNFKIFFKNGKEDNRI